MPNGDGLLPFHLFILLLGVIQLCVTFYCLFASKGKDKHCVRPSCNIIFWPQLHPLHPILGNYIDQMDLQKHWVLWRKYSKTLLEQDDILKQLITNFLHNPNQCLFKNNASIVPRGRFISLSYVFPLPQNALTDVFLQGKRKSHNFMPATSNICLALFDLQTV